MSNPENHLPETRITGGVDIKLIVQEIVDSFGKEELGKSHWANTLNIDPRTLQAAAALCAEEEAAADPANPPADPYHHITELVYARIKVMQSDPYEISLWEEKVAYQKSRNEWRETRQTYVRRIRRTMAVLTPIALAAGLYWKVTGDSEKRHEAEITDARNQERMDQVMGIVMGSRDDYSMPQNGGPDLNGVRLRFPCKKDPSTGVWSPMRAEDGWTTSELKGSYFGVEFQKGEPRAVSVAEAGWGVTAQFNQYQMVMGLPYSLMATKVEVPYVGTSYVLPTGSFVPDRDAIVNYHFTTGAYGKDGKAMTYFLLDSYGEPICFRESVSDEDKKRGFRMVNAELHTELPKKKLNYFIQEHLKVDPGYKKAFDEYGLGTWYEGIHPGLIRSLDEAIGHGSTRGVPDETFQVAADYFKNRSFEAAFLKVLDRLKEELNDESFKNVVYSLSRSRMPTISFAERALLQDENVLGRTFHAARGAGIVFSLEIDEATITHEFLHALLQSHPDKADALSTRPEPMNGKDKLFIEATTAKMERVAHPSVGMVGTRSGAYYGRVNLLEEILSRGYWNEMMDYYTLNPTEDLSKADLEILEELEVVVPMSPNTRHGYAVLLEALGVRNGMSEADRKRAKEVFSLIEDVAEDESSDESGRLEEKAFRLGEGLNRRGK